MEHVLSKLISKADRDRVMAPIETAATLPSQAYNNEDWFNLEKERIFRRRWMGVQFGCRVSNIGDVLPFEFLGIPLVAIRGGDSTLRVFHNICPYDGCPVALKEECGLESITVLYHGWRYSLEGQLISAPYWNGNSDCTVDDMPDIEVDLVEVRSAERFGILLINLDGNAVDVDDWLRPWRRTVGEYFAIGELAPAIDSQGQPLIEERTVSANWKTYQENASINVLHEAFTHALYGKSMEVPRVDESGKPMFSNHIEGALIAFSHDRTDSDGTYDAINLPMAGHDPTKKPAVGFFSTIYPNINVPLLDAMVKVNLAIPLSSGRTKLLHLRFYRPEAIASEQFQLEEQALQSLFDVIHGEDQVAIEAVHRARMSPVCRQHFYAPFWDTLHHYFNQMVMLDLEQDVVKETESMNGHNG